MAHHNLRDNRAQSGRYCATGATAEQWHMLNTQTQEVTMGNDNIIYVDMDGRALDRVAALNTTKWTEEDFCAFDGLTNDQTREFAWMNTGCTTPCCKVWRCAMIRNTDKTERF